MSAAADPDDSSNGSSGLRDRLRQLYHGRTPAALRFQFATLIVDILIIGFFVATPMLRDRPEFLWLDYTVAIIVAYGALPRGDRTGDDAAYRRSVAGAMPRP